MNLSNNRIERALGWFSGGSYSAIDSLADEKRCSEVYLIGLMNLEFHWK